MRRQIWPVLLAAALQWGCNRGSEVELSPRNPLLTAPPSSVPPNLFEDYDSVLTGNLTYGDGGAGASCSGSLSASAAHSGATGLRVLITAQGWGAGIRTGTHYGVRDFSGRTRLKLWVYSSTALTKLRVLFNEQGAGENAEVWQSPATAVAAGAWQELDLDISAFTEDPYGSAPCNGPGNCHTAGHGNSLLELGAVEYVQFKVDSPPNVVGATLDIDDVRFE